MPSLSLFSDTALLARVAEVVQAERIASADVVEHLMEVERRRLYLDQACSSLYAYCRERPARSARAKRVAAPEGRRGRRASRCGTPGGVEAAAAGGALEHGGCRVEASARCASRPAVSAGARRAPHRRDSSDGTFSPGPVPERRERGGTARRGAWQVAS